MNIQALLNSYRVDPRLKDLGTRLAMPGPQHIQLKALEGSSCAFVLASVYNQLPFNHLVILNDREEAAYFQNDLEHLSQGLDLFYFPDSFKKPGFFDLVNKSHVLLRTEALMKVSRPGSQHKVLVTYPEALFEKVVPPGAFADSMMQFQVGDVLDLDALMGRLIVLGFERSDFVYGPGQFALRGGILDIYSYGNEKPYRIELFGNDIESIRIFDPETQLSERKLTQVTLIPNMEALPRAGSKVSLLEFLPENTLVWIKNLDFTVQSIHQLEQRLSTLPESLRTAFSDEDDESTLFTEADCDKSERVEQLLQRRVLVEWSVSQASGYSSPQYQLDFGTSEQPVFNRQFNLLIQDLKKWQGFSYAIYMFAENPKQLERLRVIFEDLDAGIQFEPMAVSISSGFIDPGRRMVCYTDHQIFQRYHKYHIKQAYSKNKALTMKALRDLQPGDFVTHIDHGVGVYSGLQKLEVNGRTQEAVRILYKDQDILYVNINSLHKISKYTGKEGTQPKVNKLGSDAWDKLKERTKNKVKDIAKDLIRLYAIRKAQQGFQHSADTYLQNELEASFLYEDTPDQSKATADVKRDMESHSPMDRLVCGDVGFGKTEIAVRAAFKTVVDGKQAAVLVPTTILAYQHFQTFSERLANFPCKVDFINRFKSAKERKETLQQVKEGKIDILVGTHALLGKEVVFHDLGLLVVDEEQKFGVAAKEKLKQLSLKVDTLTLTATPIPRTLQFSLMGARDLSIINTPPPNRQSIQTEVHVFNQELIRDAIYFESERGGQVFFIHNRVQNLQEMAGLIQGLCPDLLVRYAHGKMEGSKLEGVVLDFIQKKFDVLVCTNIVESGVDIPNANTIIINNAHHFGLSDLHQLRGRVGRSNKKAFCYLLAPPVSTLTAEARKRLQTLEQHSELGSGFQIAMRDLDIRGAGNLLGAEQSGFISEIGFDMYHKILDEAIRELKQTEFKNLFRDQLEDKQDYVSDCTIDTDLEILIPDTYVESITERLSLYQQLDSLNTHAEMEQFASELADRFGPLPPQVEELFVTLRCRRMAVALGFEKIIFKDGVARCYFISNPDSAYFESSLFQQIMQFIQRDVRNARLRQVGKNFMLVIERLKTMGDLEEFFRRMTPPAKSEPSLAAAEAKNQG